MSHDGYSHIGISGVGVINASPRPSSCRRALAGSRRPRQAAVIIRAVPVALLDDQGRGPKERLLQLPNAYDRTGLSKRAVQRAVAHLQRRQLIRVVRKSATAVPEYAVATPWIHPET